MAVAAVAVLTAAAAGAGEPVRSLREILSPEEFRQAGLERLTPAELDFLSRRVVVAVRPAPPRVKADTPPGTAAAGAVNAPGGPETDAFGHEERLRARAEAGRAAQRSVSSRIAGEFRGWDRHTVFALENGQVWAQADEARFSVRLRDPVVTIERGAFGTFFLGVEGYGSRVKVRRVR